MPATLSYKDQLNLSLQTAADNKKKALDQALQRATGAIFDPSTGQLSYRTDPSGNPLYGTIDVDYMEQQRGINAQSEGAGMLRSGQRARNLAMSEAAYRSTVTGLAEDIAAQKTALDDERITQQAENEAKYGKQPKASTGGGPAAPKPPAPKPPASNVPKPPTPPSGPIKPAKPKPVPRNPKLDKWFPSSTPRYTPTNSGDAKDNPRYGAGRRR